MAAEYIVGWATLNKVIRAMRSLPKRIARVETETRRHAKVLEEQGKSLHDQGRRIEQLEKGLQKKTTEAHGLKIKLGKEKKKTQLATTRMN